MFAYLQFDDLRDHGEIAVDDAHSLAVLVCDHEGSTEEPLVNPRRVLARFRVPHLREETA